jgi:hypothetical protein
LSSFGFTLENEKKKTAARPAASSAKTSSKSKVQMLRRFAIIVGPDLEKGIWHRS